MKRRRLLAELLALSVCILLSLPCPAPAASPQPGTRDKCPVCGMFVAKYPEWSTSLTFKDGTTEFFDGAKDLFRFYQGVARYAPRRTPAEIRDIRVKDYYTLAAIDARSAWYVIGSDVMGPMGREAVAFAREADARSFFKDHHGSKILRFSEVTPTIVKGLE
ncbi:MAG: nitrous oxide reductase accessory protein NosL [Desulfuromonadales bacterium]|nr:nitrous oxide reductase accessory protein NosL [Desulfuromonadales bacterium]